MAQESTTVRSPSSSTGTLSEPCGAIAPLSVKHHGIVSADSPLCASAIRARQQYGLKGRVSSMPTSSKSLSDIGEDPYMSRTRYRHCRAWPGNPSFQQAAHAVKRARPKRVRQSVLPHHRRGLAEQDPALLLGPIDGLSEIRIDLFRLGVRAHRGGPRLNRFQPSL